MFKVWASTRQAADWLIQSSNWPQSVLPEICDLAPSDAAVPSRFHTMPDHIKRILYLDCPDIIVEYRDEPVLAVEVSREAGTGHNAFQRFARIAAAVENGVPVCYVYPEAVYVWRGAGGRWDPINPLVFLALERLMVFFQVPAFLFYYPSMYHTGKNPPRGNNGLIDDPSYPSLPLRTDPEMADFFTFVNQVVNTCLSGGASAVRNLLTSSRLALNRRTWMLGEYHAKHGQRTKWSPLTAAVDVPTCVVEAYISQFSPDYAVRLPRKRPSTVIYQVGSNEMRADPYTGALAALDYLACRNGRTYEDRDKNLVVCWGSVESWDPVLRIAGNMSVADFVAAVQQVREAGRCLLGCMYSELADRQKPRYYMQARYGCTFTKAKEIRIYSYFADALLFGDGAFWREA